MSDIIDFQKYYITKTLTTKTLKTETAEHKITPIEVLNSIAEGLNFTGMSSADLLEEVYRAWFNLANDNNKQTICLL